MGHKWPLLITLLLAVFLVSCGGASTLTESGDLNAGGAANPATDSLDARFQDWLDSQAQIGGSPEGMDALPPLPFDDPQGKVLSEAEGENMVVLGKDFVHEQGATVDGNSAILHRADEDNEYPAFAVYRFSGLLDKKPISLNVECMPEDFGDRYWVGVADYTNFTWRWFGPVVLPEYEVDLSDQDWSFITNLGNMYFVIATPHGLTATHSQSTLVFGPNEPPSLPGAPTELVASDGEFAEGVALHWNASHGAQWYRIVRRLHNNQGPSGGVEGGGEWTFLGESEVTEFFDETAEPGVVYDYKVQASNPTGQSGWSNIDSGFASGEGGDGFDLFGAFIEGEFVVLEWGGPEHELFKVWRAVGEGEFVSIAETDDHRYEDHAVEHNVVYHYKVSYVNNETEDVVFSNTVHLVWQGGGNEGFELWGFPSENGQFIVLEWEAQEDHSSYVVYRAVGEGEFIARDETEENRWEDHDVEPGVNYHYKVKAIRLGMEPEWSNTVTVSLEGESHEFMLYGSFNELGTAVNLEWQTREDHTGYMVQKRIGDGEWFNLDDTSLNHYTDEEVSHNVWYSYRVLAYHGEGEPYMSNVVELYYQGGGGGEN